MGRALVIFSAIFSAIGGFLFGYDSGIISSTVAQPQFIDYFDEPSNAQTGGIVSAYQGGAIIGCVMVAYLGDILGVAVGQLTSTVPIYCAEIAPPTIRGMLSGLLQWMLSWGYFAAQWIGFSSWREIIDNPSWRRRLLLGCGIQAFGQLSGINVINYYGPRIYESLGIKTSGTLMITGINGTTGIVENTLILLIIDKVGRIRPLTVGAFGMATCMLVNAVLNKEFPADSVNPNGNALRAQVAMNFCLVSSKVLHTDV
ncbi:hypothetical protein SEUCBS140593_006991 [Sporothrix eucalyptigena]|uniref:Major facilitator superfamily (MFS) profile domain-containing protein n=1 Tax=Sporothrix eucalyptigena TaxID=1812306 RepID=A0ABP0C9I3_9PEZI